MWTERHGELLEWARRSQGMSVQQLAAKSGKSTTSITNLEAGERRDGEEFNPRESTYLPVIIAVGSKELADEFGIDLPTGSGGQVDTDEIMDILIKHLRPAIVEISERMNR